MKHIGIDLGGTKIEGVLLDSAHRELARRRTPTGSADGYQAIVERIGRMVEDLAAQGSDSCSVGICTPGAISKHSGRIKNSNTLCLIDQPLKEDLEARLGLPVAMGNDANCFAVAEATLGAGRGYPVVFGVIMGTGVGGGIAVDGRVLPGRTNIAGEWGHHKIHPGDRSCYCGQTGCTEAYISGPALERRWRELGGSAVTVPEIIAQHSREPFFDQWKEEFLENFGVALANVINILDPDAVVLGGGVSNVPFLYDEGVAAVYRQIFSDVPETPILKNQLGDTAGVFGAAMLPGR